MRVLDLDKGRMMETYKARGQCCGPLSHVSVHQQLVLRVHQPCASLCVHCDSFAWYNAVVDGLRASGLCAPLW